MAGGYPAGRPLSKTTESVPVKVSYRGTKSTARSPWGRETLCRTLAMPTGLRVPARQMAALYRGASVSVKTSTAIWYISKARAAPA